MKYLAGICFVFVFLSSAFAESNFNNISSKQDFSVWARSYYMNPRPELVESAIHYVGRSGMASDRNIAHTLLMSFSCIFDRYDSSDRDVWGGVINAQAAPARALLTAAINNSPDEILDGVELGPAKNDMNWACFFATGNEEYIDNVISVLEYHDEREELMLFMTAATAKWSLASNSRYHPKVKAAVERLKARSKGDRHDIAVDILTMSPKEIQQETVATLRELKR